VRADPACAYAHATLAPPTPVRYASQVHRLASSVAVAAAALASAASTISCRGVASAAAPGPAIPPTLAAVTEMGSDRGSPSILLLEDAMDTASYDPAWAIRPELADELARVLALAAGSGASLVGAAAADTKTASGLVPSLRVVPLLPPDLARRAAAVRARLSAWNERTDEPTDEFFMLRANVLAGLAHPEWVTIYERDRAAALELIDEYDAVVVREAGQAMADAAVALARRSEGAVLPVLAGRFQAEALASRAVALGARVRIVEPHAWSKLIADYPVWRAFLRARVPTASAASPMKEYPSLDGWVEPLTAIARALARKRPLSAYLRSPPDVDLPAGDPLPGRLRAAWARLDAAARARPAAWPLRALAASTVEGLGFKSGASFAYDFWRHEVLVPAGAGGLPDDLLTMGMAHELVHAIDYRAMADRMGVSPLDLAGLLSATPTIVTAGFHLGSEDRAYRASDDAGVLIGVKFIDRDEASRRVFRLKLGGPPDLADWALGAVSMLHAIRSEPANWMPLVALMSLRGSESPIPR